MRVPAETVVVPIEFEIDAYKNGDDTDPILTYEIYEIGVIQAKKKAETASDIVRTHRIMDVEEEIIIEGFPQVVEMAYAGELSLDEYIYFIWNNSWGRYYEFELSVIVDWGKVQTGIKKAIKNLLDSRKEG